MSTPRPDAPSHNKPAPDELALMIPADPDQIQTTPSLPDWAQAVLGKRGNRHDRLSLESCPTAWGE
jgi:hypothetical protein